MMARRDIMPGEDMAGSRFLQWGWVTISIFEPVEIPDVVKRIGRRIWPDVNWDRLKLRDKVRERRVPYLTLWLPSWDFGYDFARCCYCWRRALLICRPDGIRVAYARHPAERGFAVTDLELTNRRAWPRRFGCAP